MCFGIQWHSVQSIPDKFKDSRFTSASGSDDTVKFVCERIFESVQETADNPQLFQSARCFFHVHSYLVIMSLMQLFKKFRAFLLQLLVFSKNIM